MDFKDNLNSRYIGYLDVYNNYSINYLPNNFVHIDSNEQQNKVNYGDILFTNSSETKYDASVSSVFLYKTNKDIYLNSFCFIYRLNSFDNLLPEYAQFLFRSTPMRTK